MSYKSVFTYLLADEGVSPVLGKAAGLCQHLGAHLDVLCVSVDEMQADMYVAGAGVAVLAQTLAQAKDDTLQLVAACEKALLGETLKWSVDAQVSQIALLGQDIAYKARFCDLAVMPFPYGGKFKRDMEAALEGALLEGQCPILLLPQNVQPTAEPGRVVLAWNESPEAMRAVRAALPLLQGSDQVHVTVVDPSAHAPDRSDPGGLIARYLVRHGIRVQIDILARSMPRVSDVIARHASDIGADLVVMGGYGHSRFRESLLGGATRDMLESSAVPILMAH